tara:strand:+ start:2110 stop:3918 length:1809 start_codon:yes stop_codon:yes gene_type:complete
MLFLAYTIGDFCLKKFKNNNFSILTKTTLGLCIIPYIVFLMGIFNILSEQSIIVLHISICIMGIANRQLTNDLSKKIKELIKLSFNNGFQIFCICFLIIQGLIYLLMSFTPPIGIDDLMYHFYFPKLYLKNNFIDYFPDTLLSAIPQHMEMLWTWCIAINSVESAQLLNWVLGYFVCLWIYKVSSELIFNKRIGLIAVTFFYSISSVGPVLYTGGVEIGAALFFISSIYFLIKYFTNYSDEYLIISSIFLAGFCNTKLPYFAIATLVIFFTLIKTFNKYGKNKIFFRGVLIQSLIVLALSSNWLIFNFFETGNPVYPWLSKILGGPAKNLEYFYESSKGLDQSFNHLFNAFERFFSQLWFLITDIKRVRGSITPLFVALFFLSIIIKPWKKNPIIKNILIISGLFYVVWISLYPFVRLALPMFSIFSIYVAVVYDFILQLRDKYIDWLLKFTLGLFLMVSLGEALNDFYPRLPFLTFQVSKNEYLNSDYVIEHGYTNHEAVIYINDNLPIDSKILLWSNDGFYIDRDIVYSLGYLWTMIDPQILDKPQLIIQDLTSRGITHVAMTDNWWRKDFKENLIKSGKLETVFLNEEMTIARIIDEKK